MLKFSEYAKKRMLDEAPDNLSPAEIAQANSPAGKAKIQQSLTTAMNAPPPPGTQPQQYRNKLSAAINIAKTTPVSSATQAIDAAKVRMAASKS